MTIEVLVCRPNGTQTLEQREVPDNWFADSQETTTDEATAN